MSQSAARAPGAAKPGWRGAQTDVSIRVSVGQLVLSACAIGLLLISGWIGGMLAYKFGVRVAAERHQADGFTAYPR